MKGGRKARHIQRGQKNEGNTRQNLAVGEIGACGGELLKPELDPSELEPWSPLWLSSVGYEEDCECEVLELEFCCLPAPPVLSWWSGLPEYASNLCRSRADDMAFEA